MNKIFPSCPSNRILFFLFSVAVPFLFSGCSWSEKFFPSGENPALKKSTELTNAQRINQQAINNPVPLVPGKKKAETGQPPTEQTSSPEETTPSQPPYDEQKWRDFSAQYVGAILKTNFGSIEFSFFPQEAPLASGNFIDLAKTGFYDNTKFHRVIKDFMIQAGDPNSKDADWSDDGKGGPGYKFPDEPGERKLTRGTVAMANSGPNTNGSQFFIVTADATPWLDGKHTVFGQVTKKKSLETVEKIEKVKTDDRDHPTEDVIIESIELLPTKTDSEEERKE